MPPLPPRSLRCRSNHATSRARPTANDEFYGLDIEAIESEIVVEIRVRLAVVGGITSDGLLLDFNVEAIQREVTVDVAITRLAGPADCYDLVPVVGLEVANVVSLSCGISADHRNWANADTVDTGRMTALA